MSSITPIDNTNYAVDTSLFSVQPMDTLPREIAPVENLDAGKRDSNADYEAAKAVISSYYQNIKPENFRVDYGSNVKDAAQDLDNAMVSAVEHGFNIQTAMNIQSAKAAYLANVNVFNQAQKTTFEIEV